MRNTHAGITFCSYRQRGRYLGVFQKGDDPFWPFEREEGPGRGERFGIFPLPGRFFRPFLAGTRKGPAGGMPADRTAQSRRRHADAANSAAPSTIDTEWEYGSFDSIDVPLRMTAPGGWRRRVAHTVRRYRRGGCLSTRIRRLRLPVPSRIYCVPNFFDTLRAHRIARCALLLFDTNT